MNIGHVLIGGVVAGLAGVMTSWLITGVIFHPFQGKTPGTWRAAEGGREYAMASLITILTSVAIAAFFAMTGGIAALKSSPWPLQGIAFGACCWGAMAAPMQLSSALFVNLHRGFVLGLLLNWLVVAMLAGMGGAWAALG